MSFLKRVDCILLKDNLQIIFYDIFLNGEGGGLARDINANNYYLAYIDEGKKEEEKTKSTC